MRSENYSPNKIRTIINKKKIATMPELETALGTKVSMTVVRKLRKLSYCSSCSHRGKYYTLKEIASFDKDGLWSCKSVLFSKYGTLIETVKSLVITSERGYTSAELMKKLGIEVKEPLFNLFRKKEVYRQKLSGHYVYCSNNPSIRRGQLLSRRHTEIVLSGSCDIPFSGSSEAQKKAVILFFSHLNEKQRRLYAGLESLKRGHGGDIAVADLLGLSSQTVSRGRHELENSNISLERVRRVGAGRPTIKKN